MSPSQSITNPAHRQASSATHSTGHVAQLVKPLWQHARLYMAHFLGSKRRHQLRVEAPKAEKSIQQGLYPAGVEPAQQWAGNMQQQQQQQQPRCVEPQDQMLGQLACLAEGQGCLPQQQASPPASMQLGCAGSTTPAARSLPLQAVMGELSSWATRRQQRPRKGWAWEQQPLRRPAGATTSSTGHSASTTP